ncbi:MAG: methyl-accepting chemotaxis protein [Deltaproteobacteria bacterium]|nr:methyl-accepting chemotaxis protein [Deltaproteobacteria bacterium]
MGLLTRVETGLLGPVSVGGKLLVGFLLTLMPIIVVLVLSARASEHAGQAFARARQADNLADCVQQSMLWCTDYSLTFMPDSLAKMEAEARRFEELSRGLSELEAGDPDAQARLAGLQGAYRRYLEVGRRMGEMYIQFGRVVGNSLTEQFHREGEQLSSSLVSLKMASAQRAEVSIARLKMLSAGASVFIVVLIAVAALFFGWRLAIPIRALTQVGEQLSTGHIRTAAVVQSRDDLGRLARAFERFSRRLTEIVGDLIDTFRRFQAQSQELHATAGSLSRDAQAHAARVSHATSATAQLSRSIQEVATSAAEAARATELSSETARSGMKRVEAATEAIQRTARSTQETARRMTKLGEVSQQIGAIVTVIRDLAEQSDVLALNAAIEAARAGEHGRGFAVVARENRNLAEETRRAAVEVARRIDGVQAEALSVVGASQESSLEVERGVALAIEAGESLRLIVGSSLRAREMVERIASATGEQSSAASEVSVSMQSALAVTRSSESSAEAVRGAAGELAALATKLDQTISWFKLEA